MQGGRLIRQQEQHSMLDNRGTAESSGRGPHPQNTLHDHTLSDMCEDVLLKTLHTLVAQVVRAESDPTASDSTAHR